MPFNPYIAESEERRRQAMEETGVLPEDYVQGLIRGRAAEALANPAPTPMGPAALPVTASVPEPVVDEPVAPVAPESYPMPEPDAVPEPTAPVAQEPAPAPVAAAPTEPAPVAAKPATAAAPDPLARLLSAPPPKADPREEFSKALYYAAMRKPMPEEKPQDPLLGLKMQLHEARIAKLMGGAKAGAAGDDAAPFRAGLKASLEAAGGLTPEISAAIDNMTYDQLKQYKTVPFSGERIGETKRQHARSWEEKDEDQRRALSQFDTKMAWAQTQAKIADERAAGTALQGFGAKIDGPTRAIVTTLGEIEKDTAARNPDGTMTSLIRGAAPEGATLSNWDKVKLSLPKGVGTQITEPQKAELQLKVKMLSEVFGRGLAGANFTPQEMDRMGNILNDAMLADSGVQAAAIDLIRRMTADKLRTTEAAFSASIPESMWQTYAQNGGVSTRMGIFSDLYGGDAVGRADRFPGINGAPPLGGVDTSEVSAKALADLEAAPPGAEIRIPPPRRPAPATAPSPAPSAGGLSPEKKARLEELRRKAAEGKLQ